MKPSLQTLLGRWTPYGFKGTSKLCREGPPPRTSMDGPGRQQALRTRRTGGSTLPEGRLGAIGWPHPGASHRARLMPGAELRGPRPSSPPRMPKETGCSNRMRWPRRRLGNGGSSGGSPPTRSPRPSRLRSCPTCPPSQVTSYGTWSGTYPGPRPKAWTRGPRMTSRHCPGRLSTTWPRSSPRWRLSAGGQRV